MKVTLENKKTKNLVQYKNVDWFNSYCLYFKHDRHGEVRFKYDDVFVFLCAGGQIL